MKLEIHKNYLKAIREPNDPKYYSIVNAAGESRFLHAVKKALIELGYDVVKKRMVKDGHLVDDLQQYIKMRDNTCCWFNDHWAINGLDEDFNKGYAVLICANLTN